MAKKKIECQLPIEKLTPDAYGRKGWYWCENHGTVIIPKQGGDA